MENDNKDVPSNGLSKEVLSKLKIKRQFEIFVEELDEEGGPGRSPIWKAVKSDPNLGGMGGNPIITVTSQSDLQEKTMFYRQLGQRFKIVREINPPTADQLRQAAIEQGLIKDNQLPADSPAAEKTAEEAKPVKPSVCKPASDNQEQTVKLKPKIITIGDMQIKYDGDKVYQKQWIKLTPAESANFRVVSDSNNKIVPMNGKHLEAKRWTLVENTSGESDSTEDLING